MTYDFEDPAWSRQSRWGYASRVNFWIGLSMLVLCLYMYGLLTGIVRLHLIYWTLYWLGLSTDSWEFLLGIAAIIGLLSFAVLVPILSMAIFIPLYIVGLGIVGALYAFILVDQFDVVTAGPALYPGLVASASFFTVSVIGLYRSEMGEWGTGERPWLLFFGAVFAGLLMLVHYQWWEFLFTIRGPAPTEAHIPHFIVLTSWTVIAVIADTIYKRRQSYYEFRDSRPAIKEAAGVMVATFWLLLMVLLFLVLFVLQVLSRSR